MQVDYLIVGQGICGTMLSWFLHKEDKSFFVIDRPNTNAPSRVAAGIINPVTGRRYSYTWMIDDLMPFALETYRELGREFDTTFIRQNSLIDFFPSPQMMQAFIERHDENDTYLHAYPNQNMFNEFFNYDFGCGEIRPAYTTQLAPLITSWREKLESMNVYRSADFINEELRLLDEGIQYDDITAQKIIFCEGPPGAANPYFSLLPYAANKGEALTIECTSLPADHIFKKGLTLAPTSQPGIFWCGSNYLWEFEDEKPSKAFYDHAKSILDSWLKVPYTIIGHKAALRPATLERRPFVGLHPKYPQVGVLNGMGTKGTSLAPFFAMQLVQHLVYDLPIHPDADVKRFTRILSR